MNKLFVVIALVCISSCSQKTNYLPDGFVYLNEVVPDIVIDLRYYSKKNFVGDTIEGYHSNNAIITLEAANALFNVSNDLRKSNYGIMVFDVYRPQRSVNHFVRWARDLDDTLMKSLYYPEIKKSKLFEEGYIAEKSGHSRGSTIDLTLFYLDGDKKGEELDMGTSYDFFSLQSWPSSMGVTDIQRGNRMLLRDVMLKHGFKPLREEWWHFTLKSEPFANSYFDFLVN
jgi:zinc D-Ala-D-Ala dipeptidase